VSAIVDNSGSLNRLAGAWGFDDGREPSNFPFIVRCGATFDDGHGKFDSLRSTMMLVW
jgi:hypothetical protein